MAAGTAMPPRRAMYLYATTMAVADGETSLLKPLEAVSIGKVGALESGCPLVCSRNALQSLQLGRLTKSACG